MKRLLHIFILISLCFLIALTGSYFYLKAKGKDIIIANIQEHFEKKIIFDKISVSFPLTLKVKNLSIEDLGAAKEVNCSLSLVPLLLKEIHFSSLEIIEPDIKLKKKKEEALGVNIFIKSDGESSGGARQEFNASLNKAIKQDFDFRIFIGRLIIKKGRLSFFESEEGEESLLFTLHDFDLRVQRIIFPVIKSLRTNFDLEALISGFDNRFNNDNLKSYGWVDFYKKDMEGKLQVGGMNGQVGLLADLISKNNNMIVKGKMNLAFGSKKIDSRPETFEDFFVEALQFSDAKIDVAFQFKTKMDNFNVGKVSLSGQMKQNSNLVDF